MQFTCLLTYMLHKRLGGSYVQLWRCYMRLQVITSHYGHVTYKTNGHNVTLWTCYIRDRLWCHTGILRHTEISYDMEPVKLSKVKDIAMSRNETRDENTCIICNIADDLVVTTENDHSKIIAAPSIRKDSVSDRSSCLTPDFISYYHAINDCYKRFCHKRSLDRCQEIEAASVTTEDQCNVNAPGDSRKSLRKCARRSSPQSSQHNRDCLCIICDWKSHQGSGEKYRNSETSRPKRFLEASFYFPYNVFCDPITLDTCFHRN